MYERLHPMVKPQAINESKVLRSDWEEKDSSIVANGECAIMPTNDG
jgi:hypothetical protein